MSAQWKTWMEHKTHTPPAGTRSVLCLPALSQLKESLGVLWVDNDLFQEWGSRRAALLGPWNRPGEWSSVFFVITSFFPHMKTFMIEVFF